MSAGLGAATGVLGSGLPWNRIRVVGVFGVVVGGALLAVIVPGYDGWGEVAAGALGALAVYLGAAVIVAGAFRRGGTRLGLAIIMSGMALVAAGIAFIPIAGYLEAVVIPVIALRLRSLQPERYAGLRTLAKD